MAKSKTRLGVSAYAIIVFFCTIASNAVRNLLGWPGFLAITLVLLGCGLALFLRLKPERFRWYRLPAPLYWFLTLAALSIIWSQYRFESLLGTLAQLLTTFAAVTLAFVLSWHEVLRTLATALRYVIGLSLLFELWVALIVQRPLLPLWLEVPEGKIPQLLFWSRDLLFAGGPVQGLVGSSTLLGFIGLLGLIVFAVQLHAGLVGKFNGWVWTGLAGITLALTRSATVTVALLAVLIALGFALWARARGPEGRAPVYFSASAFIAGLVAVLLLWHDTVFALLGKSPTLTGRADTWEKVSALAAERPWLGWGWISYWAPWVEPFKSLDMKGGVQVMSAHNAWLDVWLQMGIIGVLVFAPLVFLTLWRVWFRAVDQPRRGFGKALPYATSALWPLLVMVALFTQSLAESRILIESGWLLLVMLAVKSRFDFQLPWLDSEPRVKPWRRVPIVREL